MKSTSVLGFDIFFTRPKSCFGGVIKKSGYLVLSWLSLVPCFLWCPNQKHTHRILQDRMSWKCLWSLVIRIFHPSKLNSRLTPLPPPWLTTQLGGSGRQATVGISSSTGGALCLTWQVAAQTLLEFCQQMILTEIEEWHLWKSTCLWYLLVQVNEGPQRARCYFFITSMNYYTAGTYRDPDLSCGFWKTFLVLISGDFLKHGWDLKSWQDCLPIWNIIQFSWKSGMFVHWC